MKIDYDALSRMTGAATGLPSGAIKQEESAEQHPQGETAILPIDVVPVRPATEAQAFKNLADADGVIADPVPKDDADALRFSAQPVETAAPKSGKPEYKLWAWKRGAKAKIEDAAESPAKKVNQARYAIIGAIVFAVGIVVAPWFANQTGKNEAEKPMGPNAAAVVASTLSNSAMGVAIPTGAADSNDTSATATVGAEPAPAQSQVSIPAAGEARYTAMLGAIKDSETVTGVPAISVKHIPKAADSKNTNEIEAPAVKRITAVPLQMETGADLSAGTPDGEADNANAKASELFKVVRIDQNRIGEFVAYIAPIGGREATQGSWAFVGDTTRSGFYIEGITAYHVLLRAPNGRVQQLTP